MADKIVDAIILDENLNRIGLIDYYTSFIWAKRYLDIGDCELYVQANPESLSLLKVGRYIVRDDDDMICEIDKIEITTDVENGDYISATGTDIRGLLRFKIANSVMKEGKAQEIMESLVDLFNGSMVDALYRDTDISGNTAIDARNMTSYEAIRQVAEPLGLSYKIFKPESVNQFWFQVIKGNDRSNSVIFSEQYENLSSTDYVSDSQNYANKAVVKYMLKETALSDPIERTITLGNASGHHMREILVDYTGTSPVTKYSEVTNTFPLESTGGYGRLVMGTGYASYVLYNCPIQIPDDEFLEHLRTASSGGTETTIDGDRYFIVNSVVAAYINSESGVGSNTESWWTEIIMELFARRAGYAALAEHAQVQSFEGAVAPDITFKYKTDYDLGDIVTVQNSHGIRATARVSEAIETFDENGYELSINFDNQEVL